jgi:hypothetical protein
MLGRLNQFVRAMLGSAAPQAAAQLPPVIEPKVPNKQQTQQSFSKRTKTSNGDQRLTATDRRTASLDILTLRNGLTTKATIHDLAAVSPDLSGSVWAYQRMVVTRGFTAVARNLDGTASPEATNALQQVIARFNYLTDYTDGFSAMSSIHSVAEALCKEFRMYGSGSLELVLDKARLPNRLQPISTTQLEFMEDTKGYTYPVQKVNGNEINLDQPTFFYEAMDQDLLQAYSDSPMEAALQATLADAEFTNDVRRVIKRALHPRLKAKINYEVFKKTIPPDVIGDPTKLREYHDNFIQGIAETVNGLEPDDALITFDTTDFDYLNNGNVTLNKEYEALQAMINSKMATGTKAPPAVLGHGSGSQNVASTETMLFVRYCEGIQNHINSLLSRALTLAVRLLGYDVYVEFAFDRIDLRPDSELEAFRSMRQSRILEQLSYGFITDEDASLQMTGHLPPKGFKPLSGTRFTVQKASSENPESNTANGQRQGALGQDAKPDTPEQKKGPPVQRVK